MHQECKQCASYNIVKVIIVIIIFIIIVIIIIDARCYKTRITY